VYKNNFFDFACRCFVPTGFNQFVVITSMRIKRRKLIVLSLIISVVLVFTGISYNSTAENLTEDLEPFGWDVKVQKAVPYPTKPRNMTIPTKSPEEIRQLILKYGARGELPAKREPEMPDQPFGPNLFNSDDELRLKIDELKPEDLNPAPKLNYPTIMPKIDGENIISMTLYGSTLRYTMGAIKNAEMVKENFPGWKLRLYTETPKEHPKYGIVPQTVIDRLRFLGAEIHYMEPDDGWIPPMMWRFLVADDEYVDRFIVRDTDARLSERDAAAVYAWVKSDKTFHCVRDHPSHAAYPISGGMWGAKPKELIRILHKSWRDMMRGLGKHYLQDMDFLNKYIWPKVQNHTYCSDSVSCDVYPNSHPFPVPRYGYEHVGQVVSEHELGRPEDIRILRQAGENENCVPKGFNRLGIPVRKSL
jgi:hypothetical protein